MLVGFPKTLSNSCAWNSLLGHCRSTLSYDGISHLSRRSGRGRTSAKNGNVTLWAVEFYVDWCLVFEPRATGFSLAAGFSNLLGSLILGNAGSTYSLFIPLHSPCNWVESRHICQVSLKSAWHSFLCRLHRRFTGRNEWLKDFTRFWLRPQAASFNWRPYCLSDGRNNDFTAPENLKFETHRHWCDVVREKVKPEVFVYLLASSIVRCFHRNSNTFELLLRSSGMFFCVASN